MLRSDYEVFYPHLYAIDMNSKKKRENHTKRAEKGSEKVKRKPSIRRLPILPTIYPCLHI